MIKEKTELTELDQTINIMKFYSAFGTVHEKKEEVIRLITKRLEVDEISAEKFYDFGLFLAASHPHLYTAKW